MTGKVALAEGCRASAAILVVNELDFTLSILRLSLQGWIGVSSDIVESLNLDPK